VKSFDKIGCVVRCVELHPVVVWFVWWFFLGFSVQKRLDIRFFLTVTYILSYILGFVKRVGGKTPLFDGFVELSDNVVELRKCLKWCLLC
jgi:hypothetical protein